MSDENRITEFEVPKDWRPMPNPTKAELADPMFEAIWQTIKRWDINVPTSYNGYCGADGSHVTMILRAIKDLPTPSQRKGIASTCTKHQNSLVFGRMPGIGGDAQITPFSIRGSKLQRLDGRRTPSQRKG